MPLFRTPPPLHKEVKATASSHLVLGASLPGDPNVGEDCREDGGGEPSEYHLRPGDRLVEGSVALPDARRSLRCAGDARLPDAWARALGWRNGRVRPAEIQCGDSGLRRRRPRHR
ncbi:unnamed protein product [Musa banksii]